MTKPTLLRLRSLASRLIGTWLLTSSLSLVAQSSAATDLQTRSQSPKDFVESRYLRADALRKDGNNKEALAVLKEAIRFDSECGKCFGLLSGIEGNLGMYRQGFADGDLGVKKSLSIRDKALAAYNMGFNLVGLGRRSEALSAYEDCIKFDPTYPMCYFGKGKTLVEFDEFVDARRALERATTLNPKHGPSWAFKAIAEGGVLNAAASLADAQLAVQLAPTDPRSYLARAYAFGVNKKFEEMLADTDRVLVLDPQRARAHLMRGDALRLLGRTGEASHEFDLEPDRQAVAKYLIPEANTDLRLSNCGDYSTDIQTPDNFNVEGFVDCKERVLKALEESAVPVAPKPAPKRSIPGLPQKKANYK